MPTMHNRQRRTPGKVSERDVDRLIRDRQDAAAQAAQQIIERARAQGQERQRVCPPCTGNCNQGDACPARLAEQRRAQQLEAAAAEARAAAAQAKVDADRQLTDLPTGRWALLAYVALVAGTVLASHAYASGWFQ